MTMLDYIYCPDCSAAFLHEEALEQHIADTHTPDELLEDDEAYRDPTPDFWPIPPTHCQICGERLDLATPLERAAHQHTDCYAGALTEFDTEFDR